MQEHRDPPPADAERAEAHPASRRASGRHPDGIRPPRRSACRRRGVTPDAARPGGGLVVAAPRRARAGPTSTVETPELDQRERRMQLRQADARRARRAGVWQPSPRASSSFVSTTAPWAGRRARAPAGCRRSSSRRALGSRSRVRRRRGAERVDRVLDRRASGTRRPRDAVSHGVAAVVRRDDQRRRTRRVAT